MGNFKSHLLNFMNCRVEEICKEVSTTNKYKDLSRESARLFNDILMAIPEQSQNLLFDYESILLLRQAMIQDSLYKSGFLDYMKISRFLRRGCE